MKTKLYPLLIAGCVCTILLYQPMSATAQASKKYPQGYFRWPLNLAPEIVANMGELRSNHWHMGLDIRTDQKVNQRVYAAAEGYIAFAGIRPLSFGRFIIINHPNGFSTLYAHLNDFAPELEAYVTQLQYQQESWPAELTFPKEKFPVLKGSFIAYSGTTGGSQGPHVHFEIRDTKTNQCLNPLLFGFPIRDNIPPSIVKLALYDRSISVFEQSPQFFAVKNTTNGYVIPKMSVVKTKKPMLSFGLQAYDRITGSQNQDGIYSAKLFVDNQPQIEFVIDSIDYDETRYMNAHIDYKYKEGSGAFLQHLSLLPGDKGGVYHPFAGTGVVLLNDTSIHDVRIEIKDSYGNGSELNFKIQKEGPDEAVEQRTVPGSFLPNQMNKFDKPGFKLDIPPAALYDRVIPSYTRISSNAANAISDIHQLNDETFPVHSDMTVKILPDRALPAGTENKLIIRRTYRNSNSVRLAKKEGQWLTAAFADFGSYQAFYDLTPPSLNELGSGDTINLSASTRIMFTPADNVAVKNFRAELNGQWLRFTNDKARTWIYTFDERCPYGVHELKVRVEDIAGNVTEKKWWFKRAPYTPPKKIVRKKTTKKKTTSTKKKKK